MRTLFALIAMLSALPAPLLAADEAFFQEAASAGLAEVTLGQLAATQASSDRVKSFAKLMIQEHGAANARLQAAAARSSVQLPVEPTGEAQAMHSKLASLSGAAFDLEYLQSQIASHKKTTALLEAEIASGTDAAAKAWARDTLPTVKRHAEMIGTLDAAAGEHDVEHAVGIAGPADAPQPATSR